MRPKYYKPIEDQLLDLFYRILFKPLVTIGDDANAQMSMAKHGLMNAQMPNALAVALRSGRIQYEAGVFSGSFSAGISSALKAIGARRDLRENVYKLEPTKVPGWIKAEAAHYQQTSKGAHDAMLRQLDDTQKHLDRVLEEAKIHAGATIQEIQADFRDVAQAIQIRPEISEDSAARLAADYNKNVKLYVKDFSKKQITDLRSVVEQNAQEGYRFDKLIAGIKGRYAVSSSKAKFLARQETALFMSKYRRERFGEAGVNRYTWSTSHDSRVRPEASLSPAERLHAGNHRVLDGQVFSYHTKAPAKYMSSGSACNPGEDFNCRCVDRPILERILEAA